MIKTHTNSALKHKESLFRSSAKLIIIGALALAAVGCFGGGGVKPDQPASYYGAWTAAQQNYNESVPQLPAPAKQVFENQTVRQIIRTSLDGEKVRLKLSNLFGSSSVTFAGVHVAISTGGSGVDPTSDTVVTFNGKNSVTIGIGAEILSDPIPLAVKRLTDVAVSIYVSDATRVETTHGQATQTTFVSPGNVLAAQSLATAPTTTPESYYWIAALEVSRSQPANVLVTFGDSITDGAGSTINLGTRYPDQLDNLVKQSGRINFSVVNAGLGGNRWLNDFRGPKGISRFDRDVLSIAGVTHTLLMLGINDVGYAAYAPDQDATSEQLIAAINQATKKAESQGVKVILGTLLPFQGAFYYTERGEAKRQVVNAWIRGNATVQGIVDFDAAMRDPSNPLRLAQIYDSGDHLHPNDAGYARMARAVDLKFLR